jgi:hypothetical protein
MFLVMMAGSITTADAQGVYPDDYITDGTLSVYFSLDGMNVRNHALNNSLPINMDTPMAFNFSIIANGTQTLNVSGAITFWYQGYPIIPLTIRDSNNNSWFLVDPSVPPPPIDDQTIPFNEMLNFLGPIDIITGVYEATVDFEYYVEGNSTKNPLQHRFSFEIPATPLDIITSVTGITAIVFTAGAGVGLVTGINSLFDGIKTAYKLRGIQKKASEIR